MEPDLLTQYENGGDKLAMAIRGLTREDLLQAPTPDEAAKAGRWSIQEVVLHLSDAEAAFSDRIRRIIAEDNPVLMAWDENRFAERLAYKEQSAEDAVTLFSLGRKQLVKVLRGLPAEAFERTGRHSERGEQSLKVVLGFAVWHLDHHLKFINAKRELFGKLTW